MAFRDDREALRARAEVLEGEVGSLRGELERARERLAAQEAKDEKDEAELGRLRDEVESLRKRLGVEPERLPPKKTTAPALAAGAVAVVVAATAGVGYFLLAPAEKTEVVVPMPAPSPAPPPPDMQGPETTPLDAARFGAVVLSAEGVALEPGEGCVIEADLGGTGRIDRLRVFCDELIYDSRESGGTEMTTHDEDLIDHARPDGEHVYRLRWVDTGNRTGPRPQISVDTQGQTARIWRDTGRPFDLRLYVEDRSAPRVGRVIGRSVNDTELGTLHLAARVVRREGPVPEAFDEACELRGHADQIGPNGCRLLLRCGDEIVYGAGDSGYNACTPSGGPRGAPDVADDDGTTAENTDPVFHLRASEGRVTLADERGGERWEVELALSESESCDLDGSWHGRVRTMTGESGGLRVVPESTTDTTVRVNGRTVERSHTQGARAVIAPGLPSGIASVELDCRAGTGALVLEDGARYEGRFGPGFATFVGRVRGGTPATFWLRRGVSTDAEAIMPSATIDAIVDQALEEAEGSR